MHACEVCPADMPAVKLSGEPASSTAVSVADMMAEVGQVLLGPRHGP